jgi:membrane-bound serine protease (ClpP class)
MKFLTFFLFILLAFIVNAQDTTIISKPKKIYLFEIREEIAKPAWLKTQKAFDEAKEMGADLILIHMNTYGGLVDIADSIRTIILNSPIPVWVFIDNNAASAGALISIACDSIYMRKGGSIGAATVVTQDAQALPDKYQSYMRSMMRSTAEAQGRNPDIAEAMVDPDVYVEGVSDSGKVLTFTTSEAIEHNFCEGQAENIEELLEMAGITEYEIIKQELTPLDKVRGFLVSPVISGLLIMIIIGGLYFELQTPGIGFPLAASVVAALLYFAPLYLEGLANHWEILLFIVGVILLAVEVFAIPGFGVTGISGIVLVVVSLAFSMVESDGFKVQPENLDQLGKSFALVLISMFLGLISSFWIAKKTLQSRFLGHLALNTEQISSEGYTSANLLMKDLVGAEAETATILRPSGKIILNGEYYDATAEAGFIEKGEKVIVTKYESMQLFVRKPVS